jgi:hypothetical protein
MRHLSILRCFGSVLWLTFVASPGRAQETPAPKGASAPVLLRLAPTDSATQVSVTQAETGATLHVGKLKVPLPLMDVRELRTEVVTLKGGKSVGVVRIASEQRSAAVLIVRRAAGALEALWTGQLQPVGDPGERRADALEIADRDGDGAVDVVVGMYDDRIQICGQERALLSPRAVDPKTLTLRSVLLNRASTRVAREELVASAAPAGPTPPPLLHALRTVGASSASQQPKEGHSAASDGDLSTAWVEGRGLAGRFEFVTLRWTAPGRPIRAIAVVPTPASAEPAAAKHARPRVFSLLGDKGDRIVATLPEDPRPGQRYWIVPKSPLAWSCLTVSVDDVFAADIGAGTHAALAEIEAYTDVDFEGGLALLVEELGQDGTRGDDATQLLTQVRGDAVSALVTAWPKLSSVGKRRALRLLFAQPPADPRALDLLRLALRDPAREVNQPALELARKRVESGPAMLLELARDATPQGDAAALALARTGDATTLEGLLSALLIAGGTERPALREALWATFRSAGSAASDVLTRWAGPEPATPPVAARAAAALALSRLPEAQSSAAALVRDSLVSAVEFTDQWRLVQAAAALPTEPATDAWLGTLVREAKPWMLRAAALAALQTRNSSTAQSAAEHALSDAYPRVRAAGIKVLGSNAAKIELLSQYARDDKWFLVRAAAVDALPNTPAGLQVMTAALKDKTPTVRATAVRALQHARAIAAWNQIKPMLENAEEYPEVIGAGIAFAKALCALQAAPSLQAVVVRGLHPEAWSADQELALAALEALSALGGEAAAWARDHAQSPLVPKQVQAAAAAAAAKPGACRPAREL